MLLRAIGNRLAKLCCQCYVVSSDVASEKFTSLAQLKCLRALADPGEAVGLLAAQVSLGRREHLFV